MIDVIQCPVCSGRKLTKILECVDHTVSHETFPIVECETCSLRITSPRPADEQLGKYYLSDDYISHHDDSKSMVDMIYRFARVFSINWKFSLVKKYKLNASAILDYGCGTGDFLTRCKRELTNSLGVEPSHLARELARKKSGAIVASDLSLITENVDVITAWHVMEHVANLNETMKALTSKLNPGGVFMIAVPNHRSRDARKYGKDWAGYDVPRHLWHFNQASMSQLVENHGLALQDVVPMKLDAFYVSLLSEKYRHNRLAFSNLAKAVLTGASSNFQGFRSSEYSSLIYITTRK